MIFLQWRWWSRPHCHHTTMRRYRGSHGRELVFCRSVMLLLSFTLLLSPHPVVVKPPPSTLLSPLPFSSDTPISALKSVGHLERKNSRPWPIESVQLRMGSRSSRLVCRYHSVHFSARLYMHQLILTTRTSVMIEGGWGWRCCTWRVGVGIRALHVRSQPREEW